MVTMAQRIEALRTEAGLARVPASLELGFPKNAFEKFETGRQTPTKEQQEKLASYFGVSLFYLRGESNDRTRQEAFFAKKSGILRFFCPDAEKRLPFFHGSRLHC